MFRSAAGRLKSVLGFSHGPITPSRAFSEENLARYCQGGYHPVRIGDVFANGRYKVLCKLGYGVYSTVWLAFDSGTKRHVALKLLTADSYGHEQDTFEVDILSKIKSKGVAALGSQHVLGLLDNFEHVGPNGKNVGLVFRAMGPDMSKFRRVFPKSRIPVPLMKGISRQLLLALAFLHDTCQVIHSDIKPQNILIETAKINEMFENAPSKAFLPQRLPLDPPNDFYIQSTQISSAEEDLSRVTEVSVRLADFGTASWFTRHLTEWIQPQMLRAPEVILGANWDYKVDIWNLGLIIWELSEGALMFDGSWSASAPYTSEAHLAQMEAILGKMPQSLLSRSGDRNRFFDGEGQLLMPPTFPDMPLETICRNPGMSELDKALFLDMIKSMIRQEPRDRPDARSLLESTWLN
ncbi:kinase-like protein [Xylariaceae sp. AK1471]|nr:kinase-like protein [Xylariaceae sp. AK1471]